MRRLRLILWIFVGAAVLALGVLLVVRNRAEQSSATRAAANFTLGGPFTLTGADGKPFSSSSLAGKPYAIFFGFTHCPDVCPTTLSRLVRLRSQLGRADAFNIVFVSVDPRRDGPKEVGAYSTAFNAPVIGLTGSAAQIEQVKKQYGIFS